MDNFFLMYVSCICECLANSTPLCIFGLICVKGISIVGNSTVALLTVLVLC